ncbi:unnamed protein product [Pieris macdunnoughi]|uniref:Uncharacterized protein n=1 Tax=Pieris macdunnoughi TaxID=345717 RepID=A0A821Y0Y4_9NEOP|nr:unnamed protein product [Pieris macdunnoughi]
MYNITWLLPDVIRGIYGNVRYGKTKAPLSRCRVEKISAIGCVRSAVRELNSYQMSVAVCPDRGCTTLSRGCSDCLIQPAHLIVCPITRHHVCPCALTHRTRLSTVPMLQRGGGAERGGAPRAVIGRSGPAPRALKNLRKNGASARQCLSDSLGGRTPLALETARPRTGGRGREMPALALRDQPLDCSLRLRASTTPTWRDHPHGQSLFSPLLFVRATHLTARDN